MTSKQYLPTPAMSKLWDEIADEWDGTATSSSTALVIVTGGAPTTPIVQPWLTDPRYGGMTPESARRSWLAARVSTANDYAAKRLLAIIAGFTDEELNQLMTDLYGPRPHLRVFEGGAA